MKHLFRALPAACAIVIPFLLPAQERPDTSAPRRPLPMVATPKPYKEVITAKAVTDSGLFIVHQLEQRWFFEIPVTLLNRDILVVNRLAKGAAGVRSELVGYAGDPIGDQVIEFTRGPGYKIFIKVMSYQDMSRDTTANGMYRSVLNSNTQPLVAAFNIAAFTPDSSAVVLDVTSYINSDNDVVGFSPIFKGQLELGMPQPDRSYIEKVSSYPSNVEIKSVRTYQKPGGRSSTSTFELSCSMLLLPAIPMQPRYSDDRIGYYTASYLDFDVNPQGVKKSAMITRWRLEPKQEEWEKYKRGELVEPAKPIVFYIDPTTPKKWIPYLIQGVNDWQTAFEKAGFKNAIVAKEAPVNDPSWSLEDATHNAIVYKPSHITNASGPHIHDPRSGEILEAHINWYHNVMTLLRNWYFVQASPIDPKARTVQLEDSLMGQLIRFVSSHEVGHTLGLLHNFGASSTVPVEKLRDKKWLAIHGHTPSIMDYARFNYVAQPEDSVGEQGIFPHIGEYDKWAIEWGYRLFPGINADSEKVRLTDWASSKADNKALWFGSENASSDPRCQNEDLGDDAIKASEYGIKNLKRIVPNLVKWTTTPGNDYYNLQVLYIEVLNQFIRYMLHVADNVGGVMNTPKRAGQEGVIVEFVSRARQKEAVGFLQKNVFTSPTWLRNDVIYDLTEKGGIKLYLSAQEKVLTKLLSSPTLLSLQEFAVRSPQAYTIHELLTDLEKGIFSELDTHTPIDVHRRALQKMYVFRLTNLLTQDPSRAPNMMEAITAPMNKYTDVFSVVKAHMKSLDTRIRSGAAFYKDANTKMHLDDISARLKDALKPVPPAN